jgi:hypothetical protein
METKFAVLFFVVAVFCFISPLTYSQDKPESHFYEMNFMTFPYEQIDDFLKFYESGMPLDEQNEYVLSTKVFRHISGPNWIVCMLTEYKDMESYVKAMKRGEEIWLKMFPEKEKQNEIMKQWRFYLSGHTDAFVRDMPSLEIKK